MTRIKWSEKAKRIALEYEHTEDYIEATLMNTKCEAIGIEGEFNIKYWFRLKNGEIDVETSLS